MCCWCIQRSTIWLPFVFVSVCFSPDCVITLTAATSFCALSRLSLTLLKTFAISCTALRWICVHEIVMNVIGFKMWSEVGAAHIDWLNACARSKFNSLNVNTCAHACVCVSKSRFPWAMEKHPKWCRKKKKRIKYGTTERKFARRNGAAEKHKRTPTPETQVKGVLKFSRRNELCAIVPAIVFALLFLLGLSGNRGRSQSHSAHTCTWALTRVHRNQCVPN